MKLLVDGVFFQLARTGISRVWSAVLPKLAVNHGLEIVLLNRGGAPRLDGVQLVEFPAYSMASNSAADSLLLERFCKNLGADVFMSTYYTTPIAIPSTLMIYDMIPEVLEFGVMERIWLEKQTAISFASRYVCISKTTSSDLARFYPTAATRSISSYCGVDRDIFKPRDNGQVERFKHEFNVGRPYYLLVGSREGYKNGRLAFDAAKEVGQSDMEILCVGGEPQINPQALAQLPTNISARRLELTDDQLACAYAGAQALIVPSMYEGFGLPVIEAMSCGCPVIATGQGALAEISGKAAVFISGQSENELREAMQRVRDREYRMALIEGGLKHAASYDNWDGLARAVFAQLQKSFEDGRTPAMREFFQSWKKLRAIQAAVDTHIPEHYPDLLA